MINNLEMLTKVISIWIFIVFQSAITSAQVKIRLFSNQSPESALFSVSQGIYEVDTYNGDLITLSIGESLIITKFNGKLGVKVRNDKGFLCDSISFYGKKGDDSFSLRINSDVPVRQFYSGDLLCFPDLDNLVLINMSDIEKYISGVVRAEGGTGKNIEYFKSQAIIARTYMYKYFGKHLSDGYNVCDNTHCQVFNGLSSDSVINRAAFATRDMVILAPDSTLIISAFHSNCGGETSSSEDVWLTSQPYLKSVVDPYCMTSRNARWEKSISRLEWTEFIRKSGYTVKLDDQENLGFIQKSRLTDYKTGSISIPFRSIRTDLNLRSTFFSVFTQGDSIILRGKGYGHGVGLCQEGAMKMAEKGFNYRQIIDFYYTGVIITDIRNAVVKSD